jgi:hypothetical protein
MSWDIPLGNRLLIVIGRTFSRSSFSATSMLLVDSPAAVRIGAPIAIWRALAPTILAFSNRVIRGGPMMMFDNY